MYSDDHSVQTHQRKRYCRRYKLGLTARAAIWRRNSTTTQRYATLSRRLTSRNATADVTNLRTQLHALHSRRATNRPADADLVVAVNINAHIATLAGAVGNCAMQDLAGCRQQRQASER